MTEWTECSGGDCPQIRYVGGRVEIRDSARPAEVAWFSQESWERFVETLRATESLADTLLTADVHTDTAEP